MTAMTQARSLIEQETTFSQAPVKGATTILQGALVVMEAGLAVPGKTAVNLTPLGAAEATVVNAGADGASKVLAKRGTFKFFNLAADPVVSADIGKDCYIADDQTVAKTSGGATRSIAGKVINVESDGVFVRIGF